MKKQFNIFKWSVLLLLLYFCSGFVYAIEPPLNVLQHVSDKMLSQLDKHQSELKKNKALIFQIVDESLVPHVDTDRMAGLVIGRQYWESATPAQRQAFVNEFKRLVVSTYSGALASYDQDRVRFYPIRGNSAGRTVQINSMIIRKTGQQIPISYNLIQSANQWKVYDFSVEGVSIVQNYRSQFAGVLARGGLPALLQQIQQRYRGRS